MQFSVSNAELTQKIAEKLDKALHAGDVVHIPANVKHWHGAAKDSAFQHLAIEVDGTDTSTEWCEAVKEADYEALP